MFSISLRQDEKLVAHIRQTESLLLGPVLLIIVCLYVPITVLLQYELINKYGWVLFGWVLLVAGYGIRRYLLWLLNSYLLTNERVIVIKYSTLMRKQVHELDIARVGSITYETTGFLSSLLGYGDLVIESPGEDKKVLISRVRHPEHLKELILKVKKRHEAISLTHPRQPVVS